MVTSSAIFVTFASWNLIVVVGSDECQ